jgi:Putative lumazine-binding
MKSNDFPGDDHEPVRKVVELAMEGSAAGDRRALNAAFHQEARMFGEVSGHRYDAPIASFFELCAKHPLREDASYRARIESVTRVDGAAMVMVVEDGCWKTASFVDFFTVTENAGKWHITNKTFVHTAGEIPKKVLED